MLFNSIFMETSSLFAHYDAARSTLLWHGIILKVETGRMQARKNKSKMPNNMLQKQHKIGRKKIERHLQETSIRHYNKRRKKLKQGSFVFHTKALKRKLKHKKIEAVWARTKAEKTSISVAVA